MKGSTRKFREMFKKMGENGRWIYPHFIRNKKELEQYYASLELQKKWPLIVYFVETEE